MARRKPTSTRQKKAATQLKRAVKRGDIPPPEQAANKSHKKRRALTGRSVQGLRQESSKKLQSAFTKLPQTFLEKTRVLASRLALPRPLPPQSAILSDPLDNETFAPLRSLTCPLRPKWRFDMTKVEVERNEEGIFKKWLQETDEIINRWMNSEESEEKVAEEEIIEPSNGGMPRSPTYFERNLEVWRQLWRVTEISQIILVLLDCRCPLLHFPPSLAKYLQDRKIILVLTKVDISGPTCAEAWTKYFQQRHPGTPVVQVESYAEKQASAVRQGRKLFEPSLPQTFRSRLMDAIRQLHSELLQPPDKVRENPSRLKYWKPKVKQDIDWDAALATRGGGHLEDLAAQPLPSLSDEAGNDEDSDEIPKFLTVGLIGQPNVGKSSLLNALFGASKVRASKTPGKTKHFQTLFWTPDIRFVDCPGLVIPNANPLEMQVLSGTLPISQVSAVPMCTYFACQHLPLECIFNLTHPDQGSLEEDKRTWRDGAKREKSKELAWTAMDVLVAYADKKGWLTAKAGRPDVHRAGNSLLRSLAESRVLWAFWPPGTDPSTLGNHASAGTGVWIPGNVDIDDDSEDNAEDSDSEFDHRISDEEGAESEGEDVTTDENDEVDMPSTGIGRFAALALTEEDSDG